MLLLSIKSVKFWIVTISWVWIDRFFKQNDIDRE